MTGASLKKYILTPLMVSATVFSALTLPLAVFGDEPVTIQVQKESLLQGKIRDIATPYLGLAGAISLSTGIATVALTGWRQSSRKSQQTQDQLSELEQHLKKKQELLEAIKMSEAGLEASGLKIFLEAEIQPEISEMVEGESQGQPVPEQVVYKSVDLPVVQPLIIRNHPIESQPISFHQLTVQGAAAKFASAQIVLGYSRLKRGIEASTGFISPMSSQVEQLQNQLQTLMSQMEVLQMATQTTHCDVKSWETPTPIPLEVVRSYSVYSVAS
ncbi:MAG TPA: hypothetical protein DEG17_22170 [Cyanobacteria bacterium UBA11149]|nr:hypothetical protein [Cyanobacteria bacterium UBA11367]HBE59378.1 hypothetical protein [Cyanobacteria bacterium UBA11366]HBK63256.1 hypothetical protein [Cyanobacteria bacterium UBA11166]HBR75048.1 hypothetical protein [Cyanobacteria bacterium UBA11159]HBS68685.1 hypothetical protein [Cyanobacteria bacterium UBA11153]HBW91489.1 hypothetical protein [Cyanobacteria bacterium UBA11149]HCA96273.1 hypothetical protein [Cyanobacteria bacterium UBA9226]